MFAVIGSEWREASPSGNEDRCHATSISAAESVATRGRLERKPTMDGRARRACGSGWPPT